MLFRSHILQGDLIDKLAYTNKTTAHTVLPLIIKLSEFSTLQPYFKKPLVTHMWGDVVSMFASAVLTLVGNGTCSVLCFRFSRNISYFTLKIMHFLLPKNLFGIKVYPKTFHLILKTEALVVSAFLESDAYLHFIETK